MKEDVRTLFLPSSFLYSYKTFQNIFSKYFFIHSENIPQSNFSTSVPDSAGRINSCVEPYRPFLTAGRGRFFPL